MIKNETHRQLTANYLSATCGLIMLDSLHSTLKEFEGKKVIKVDGTLTKVFHTAMQPYTVNELNTEGMDLVGAKPSLNRVSLEYKSLYLKLGTRITWRVYEEPHKSDDMAYYDYDLFIAKINDSNELVLIDKDSITTQLTNDRAVKWSTVKRQQQKIIDAYKLIAELETTVPYYARKVTKFSSL